MEHLNIDVVLAALNDDEAAMLAVLQHYDNYINAFAYEQYQDEQGNARVRLDSDVKLIQNTNAFINHSLCVIEATLAGLSMRETTVAHKRSTTWLSVSKTSLRKPFSRISSHICSIENTR